MVGEPVPPPVVLPMVGEPVPPPVVLPIVGEPVPPPVVLPMVPPGVPPVPPPVVLPMVGERTGSNRHEPSSPMALGLKLVAFGYVQPTIVPGVIIVAKVHEPSSSTAFGL